MGTLTELIDELEKMDPELAEEYREEAEELGRRIVNDGDVYAMHKLAKISEELGDIEKWYEFSNAYQKASREWSSRIQDMFEVRVEYDPDAMRWRDLETGRFVPMVRGYYWEEKTFTDQMGEWYERYKKAVGKE